MALRSEEHTSELQSPCNLVCRLLLEKKNDSFALFTRRSASRTSSGGAASTIASAYSRASRRSSSRLCNSSEGLPDAARFRADPRLSGRLTSGFILSRVKSPSNGCQNASRHYNSKVELPIKFLTLFVYLKCPGPGSSPPSNSTPGHYVDLQYRIGSGHVCGRQT